MLKGLQPYKDPLSSCLNAEVSIFKNLALYFSKNKHSTLKNQNEIWPFPTYATLCSLPLPPLLSEELGNGLCMSKCAGHAQTWNWSFLADHIFPGGEPCPA